MAGLSPIPDEPLARKAYARVVGAKQWYFRDRYKGKVLATQFPGGVVQVELYADHKVIVKDIKRGKYV